MRIQCCIYFSHYHQCEKKLQCYVEICDHFHAKLIQASEHLNWWTPDLKEIVLITYIYWALFRWWGCFEVAVSWCWRKPTQTVVWRFTKTLLVKLIVKPYWLHSYSTMWNRQKEPTWSGSKNPLTDKHAIWMICLTWTFFYCVISVFIFHLLHDTLRHLHVLMMHTVLERHSVVWQPC